METPGNDVRTGDSRTDSENDLHQKKLPLLQWEATANYKNSDKSIYRDIENE